MCLFFGDQYQDCQHPQCQIVKTIRNLNSQSLFGQPNITHHKPSIYQWSQPSISQRSQPFISQRSQHPPLGEESQNLMLKMEAGQQLQWVEEEKEESDKDRIARLEKQVSELKQVTLQMKAQLQQRGLLQLNSSNLSQ